MLSGSVQMHTTAYGARKAAYGNTVRLNGEKADLIERKYGWEARQAFSAQVARNFKVHVKRPEKGVSYVVAIVVAGSGLGCSALSLASVAFSLAML